MTSIQELSHAQAPPTLPFELKDYISPNAWEARVSTLTQLASHYCRPLFERAYLAMLLVLSFLVPVTTYYITLPALEGSASSGDAVPIGTDETDRLVWLARLIAFSVTLATWIVLCVPVVVWKYSGIRRVRRLANQWTRGDMLAASSYGDAPVWKASAPGFFREILVLVVTVPMKQRSHFDRNSYLPPYINAGDDGLPSYGDSSMTQWSTDPKGGTRYGDVPIYAD
ncbi:hypothetical protein JVU11DRAFT_2604 [Chiua virens]|nr:hypothetical protein JVU11DRAFT_2604 [Chiua virens]